MMKNPNIFHSLLDPEGGFAPSNFRSIRRLHELRQTPRSAGTEEILEYLLSFAGDFEDPDFHFWVEETFPKSQLDRFRAETGTSFARLVCALKMDFATFLLVHTDGTLPEITRRIGYESQQSFRIHFMIRNFHSPKKFRLLFGAKSESSAPERALLAVAG